MTNFFEPMIIPLEISQSKRGEKSQGILSDHVWLKIQIQGKTVFSDVIAHTKIYNVCNHEHRGVSILMKVFVLIALQVSINSWSLITNNKSIYGWVSYHLFQQNHKQAAQYWEEWFSIQLLGLSGLVSEDNSKLNVQNVSTQCFHDWVLTWGKNCDTWDFYFIVVSECVISLCTFKDFPLCRW